MKLLNSRKSEHVGTEWCLDVQISGCKEDTFHFTHSKISMNIIIFGFGKLKFGKLKFG